MVATEYRTGKTKELWDKDLKALSAAPFNIGPDSLFVAYYASAEFGCFLSLGWELPENVLDLYVEFRNLTNGMELPCGKGLLGALVFFGESAMAISEKDEMRQLILAGGPWTLSQRQQILRYCAQDVQALSKLLARMRPLLDMPRALLRGRYMKTAALMEHNGIPLDTQTYLTLTRNWDVIKESLITNVDVHYGVYDNGSFRESLFRKWLRREGIPWPELPSGTLDLKDETFKDMAKSYPQLTLLRELKVSLSQMRLSELAVGTDSRNRCILSAFSSRTGRNQPSTSKFIFGPAVWIRSLIQPAPGYAVAYIDWSQQEFGIAAALSGDPNMMEAYISGDPYLTFAKQARAVPADATKQSHSKEREGFKACVLATQYGMGPASLAKRIRRPISEARDLLKLHRETYRKFWEWSDTVVNHAMLYGKLYTAMGWHIHIRKDPNPRSIRNFPMQANGAEMLRIACCLMAEREVKVCAPVHDAILIEAPISQIENDVMRAKLAMSEASAIVLDGFPLNTDAKIFRYPDRYHDPRGEMMWETIQGILKTLKGGQ